MSTIVAGVEVPETSATAAAIAFAQEHTNPLLLAHSWRVFYFGSLRATELALAPDPELLFIASLMHDTGLLAPYSDVRQRFELDGADHARKLMLEHGATKADADLVWAAIALHTTPGIPGRMADVVSATNVGVLVDVMGIGLDALDAEQVSEITAAHPRGDFKNGFLQSFVDGLSYRPETTYGTVNADVLEHFVPGFQRGSMVERIRASRWPR